MQIFIIRIIIITIILQRIITPYDVMQTNRPTTPLFVAYVRENHIADTGSSIVLEPHPVCRRIRIYGPLAQPVECPVHPPDLLQGLACVQVATGHARQQYLAVVGPGEDFLGRRYPLALVNGKYILAHAKKKEIGKVRPRRPFPVVQFKPIMKDEATHLQTFMKTGIMPAGVPLHPTRTAPSQ